MKEHLQQSVKVSTLNLLTRPVENQNTRGQGCVAAKAQEEVRGYPEVQEAIPSIDQFCKYSEIFNRIFFRPLFSC